MQPKRQTDVKTWKFVRQTWQLTKRQNTAHNDSWEGLRVDRLVGNLSRDLISANWMFHGAFAESKVSSNEGQRDWNAEPQGEDGDEGWERNGTGALLVPQNDVHDEEQAEDDAGTEDGCQQHVALPLHAAEALVDTRRYVAGRCSKQHEKDHCASHQSATICRW